MEILIKFIAQRLGISETIASAATHTLLSLLSKHSDQSSFGALLSQLPGAAAFLAAPQPAAPGSNDLLGGLLGGFGSMIGGTAGETMETTAKLEQSGLEPAQIPAFAESFVTKAKELAGPDLVNTVVGQLPGLLALLK